MREIKSHLPFMAIVFLLLGGCTSLMPKYERPTISLPETYSDGAGIKQDDHKHAHEYGTQSGTYWRDYFIGQELQNIITLSLENNRDLRIAILRVQEARANYGIQITQQLPNTGISADGTRTHTPSDLSVTGKETTGNVFQAGIGFSAWEIDFWGRIKSLNQAALETYLSTEAGKQSAELSLITQTAQSYLSLRELDERISLADKALDSRAESLRIFRRRFEVGASSKLDLVQAETLWQQARALRSQLLQAKDTETARIQFLVGAPIKIAPISKTLAEGGIIHNISDGLPSDLLTRRPDIIAAEYNIKAANANIGAARAAFYPRISLTSFGGIASSELGGLFNNGSTSWRFAPAISLPIFDGGRNKLNLSLAEVRQNQAIANYEKTIQSAFRDVSIGLSSRKYLNEQIHIVEDTLKVLRERSRLVRLRYNNGSTNFLEVLDAERELLSLEQQRVQLYGALLSNQIDLYAAFGGAPISPQNGN